MGGQCSPREPATAYRGMDGDPGDDSDAIESFDPKNSNLFSTRRSSEIHKKGYKKKMNEEETSSE